MANHKVLSLESELLACDLYRSGKSLASVGRRFGVHGQTISNVLCRHGIATRSQSEGQRRYSLDQTFFDHIDTETKAYWLGFLAADGNVFKNVVSAVVEQSDGHHLCRLKEHIGSGHPIYESETRNIRTFSVASDGLSAALVRHGVLPKKTLTLTWPDHLPAELLRHYLRGYFDGDGSFHIYRDTRGYPRLNFSITSTQDFCRSAQRYLMKAAHVGRTKIGRYPNTLHVRRLTYGGNRQVERIYHLMYDGATVYLARKRDKAAAAISESTARAIAYRPKSFMQLSSL